MLKEAPIGNESRHQQLGLSDEQLVDIYRNMLMARKYDERGLVLQRSGKVPFHISGFGQEGAQAAAGAALDRNVDYILPYYRDYALLLSLGMTVKEFFLALFAKAEDPNSGGRQMPGHFGCKRLRIVTGSSPVTTQVPHGVGIALAAKMNRQSFVSFVTFGEGSSNQGDFHEGLNFAGVHKLPVIFMCENNQYAISVPLEKQISGRIVDRAIGYGFPGYRVDGSDVLEVYRIVKEARERAIRGEGPTLIEVMTYRIMPHSTSDDDMSYRTKEEVEKHASQDVIDLFKQYLMDVNVWSEEQNEQLLKEIMAEINESTVYAENAPFPMPEDTLKYVYGEPGEES